MTLTRLLPLILSLFLGACTILPNQGPTTAAFDMEENRTPSATAEGFIVADLTPRTVKLLEGRGAPSFGSLGGAYRGAGQYRIGVGDAVSVSIWEANGGGLFATGAPGASGSRATGIPAQVVERDGAITIPYAGRVTVAGLMLSEAEAKIVEALQGKAIEPQAIVSVNQNVSNTVTVTGEVVNGRRIPLTQAGDRILDVIAAAGGARSPTDETVVTLSRGGHTLSIAMGKLIKNPSENIYARAGDTITVVREVKIFTALGATGRNTLVDFPTSGITLEKAVAKAGGLINVLSDPGGVFLLRREHASLARKLDPTFPIANPNGYVNVVYRANLRDPNTLFLAKRFDVLEDDILYVSGAPSTELQKFLTLVGLGTDSVNNLSLVASRLTP
ncbi:polysaccharide biosynthesis/export family protein [Maritimibacter sp. UBA3975]|uniref:polysaccharide biosynthesis/export family protein n=1 Tax=Maritimibacter sp. UBA3975 TaxID=1946833 RepID=UPI000C09273F|nr:polysaccharide biosynthesis/export family protein [Maritimibacter sp. UBA3975]MAM62798.1 sugar transporter [Maritimibacter sp.]|tara:strand:+ start:11202 stop:12365 length:1164 start_codon:yes stop_codon:yes gene_type:complete